MANIIPFEGKTPVIHQNSFLAISADVIGDVVVGEYVNIWNNATVRGDLHYIRIGKYANIQDGCVVHVDNPREGQPNWGPTIIGEYVTIGHGAIIHACTLEYGCLVGMGAIVLDGVVVGKGAVVGAGAVVAPNTVIPPFSLVLGTPGKIVKSLPEASINERIIHAERYWGYALQYK